MKTYNMLNTRTGERVNMSAESRGAAQKGGDDE